MKSAGVVISVLFISFMLGVALRCAQEAAFLGERFWRVFERRIMEMLGVL